MGKVSRDPCGSNAEAVTLRTYHRDRDQTKDLNEASDGVKDPQTQGDALEAGHLIYWRKERRLPTSMSYRGNGGTEDSPTSDSVVNLKELTYAPEDRSLATESSGDAPPSYKRTALGNHQRHQFRPP